MYYLVNVFNKILEKNGYKLEVTKNPFDAVIRDKDGNKLERVPARNSNGFVFIGNNDDEIHIFENGIFRYYLIKDTISIKVWNIMGGPNIEIENYGHNSWREKNPRTDKITFRTADTEPEKTDKRLITLNIERFANVAEKSKTIHILQTQTCDWGVAYYDESSGRIGVDSIEIPVDVDKYYEIVTDTIKKFSFYYSKSMNKALDFALPAIRYLIDDFQYEKERQIKKAIEIHTANEGELALQRQQLLDQIRSIDKKIDDTIKSIRSFEAQRDEELRKIKDRMDIRREISIEEIDIRIENLKNRIHYAEVGYATDPDVIDALDSSYEPEDIRPLYAELERLQALRSSIKQH